VFLCVCVNERENGCVANCLIANLGHFVGPTSMPTYVHSAADIEGHKGIVVFVCLFD
jgi:hypothetical protein